MTTLNDLKTEYQAKLDIRAAEQARQEQAEETLRQLKLDDLKPRIITWIANQEGVDEVELSQYGEVTGTWSEWNKRFDNITYTMTLPDHQPVSFSFYQDAEGKVLPYNKQWNVSQTGGYHNTLGAALLLATQTFQQQKERQEKEEADSREYEARQAAKKEREQQEQAERESILTKLVKDPIAFLLLKTFVEIQQERAGVAEQVAGLEEAMGNAEYHYDNELSATRRRIEQERQEVERVKDEARSLQYKVDDLDSELQKTKRQQRGW